MSELVNLPQVSITKDLIERIQFSLSSRNAEYKVAECAVHIFASKLSENLQDIKWQYVTSGVPCILRSRELHKNGRKYVWGMNLCLCNANYGVLVWKSKLAPNCEYTVVADNFHVFALSEVNVLVGMLFSSKEQACELNTLYTTWNQERQRDDGKKGPAAAASPQQPRFRKEMISKPCNFQHIQGTQALDECLQIEKIKADIIAALFGLGTTAGRSEADGEPQKRQKPTKRGKHEITKPKVSFKMIHVPRTSLDTPPTSPLISPPAMEASASEAVHSVKIQGSVEVTNGYSGPSMAHNDTNMTAYQEPPVPMSYQQPPVPVSYQEPAAPYQELSSPVQPQLQMPVITTDFNEPAVFVDGPSHSQNSQPEDLTAPGANLGGYGSLEPVPVQLTASQSSYGYSQSPPRLDLNLEKEFSESVLFQSPIMSAN